jgi:TPP-dependent pyruvate/acetoin dehydrogenase alpha subunit
MHRNAELYQTIYKIRRFEETVLENFPRGVFYGTTHTYVGQEANAAGVFAHLQPGDIVFSNHRCHGHFLAYGGSARSLFAELMGRSSGVCGGRGGSQHLHWQNFYSNGIQGGIAPIATGMALAEKLLGKQTIAVAFLGDGTMGEGVVYEAFNMASLWNAPILFVVENNRIAQTTPIDIALAGSIPARFSAFNLQVQELDSSDVDTIETIAGEVIREVRQTQRPAGLVLHTCRFGPHSKGDDTRDPGLVARLRVERDPLTIQASRLDPSEIQAIHTNVDAEIAAAFQQALTDPLAENLEGRDA